jgi:hypothetical protein
MTETQPDLNANSDEAPSHDGDPNRHKWEFWKVVAQYGLPALPAIILAFPVGFFAGRDSGTKAGKDTVTAATQIPLGSVMYTVEKSCDRRGGWDEYTKGRGFYLVGGSGDEDNDLGIPVGEAIRNLDNRGFESSKVTRYGHYTNVMSYSGENGAGVDAQESTNAPYIKLIMCKKVK